MVGRYLLNIPDPNIPVGTPDSKKSITDRFCAQRLAKTSVRKQSSEVASAHGTVAVEVDRKRHRQSANQNHEPRPGPEGDSGKAKAKRDGRNLGCT